MDRVLGCVLAADWRKLIPPAPRIQTGDPLPETQMIFALPPDTQARIELAPMRTAR